MASLRVQVPGSRPKLHPLYKRITSIGNAPECDVVLPDPTIGDTLAHIHYDGRDYTISALDKRDELTINGKKRKKHKLAHQDRISIGEIEVLFATEDATATDIAPAQGAALGAAGSSPRIPVVSAADAGAAEVAARADEVASFKKLYDFSAKLLEAYDLPTLLDELMDQVIAITKADKGFLVLMEGQRLDVKVARNVHKENLADAVSMLSDSIVSKVVKTKRPVIISDALNDAEFSSSESVMHLKLTSVMCVPLLERGNLLGVLYVGNDKIASLFETSGLDVLTIFSSQASLLIRNALLVNELRLDNKQLGEELERMRYGSIIGSAPLMQEVYKKVGKVATTDISVLITGETGTGKELIAREIHNRSNRAKGPFVSINCGAIPENLLESELFGHVRGAFTGAVASKQGKFHQASNGTLFLDEIGEMPTPLQVKILRALQEKVVVRVGDTRPETCDIRVLAATNRDLEAEIAAGRFREDLSYRLNVVNVHLPPLRERGDDILVIARYLLTRYAAEYRSSVKGFSPNAAIAMKKHRWPGNIRELENRLKKAIVLADKALLGPEDMDLGEGVLPPILPLQEAKEKFQRDYINEILALNNGNRTKTARDLGVDPRTVFRHLEKEEGGDPGPGPGEDVPV